MPVIAEASFDPQTRRRLNDEPLTPDRLRDSVSRTQEQWSAGTGAPFVIADAGDDRPLGLVNLQFAGDEEVGGLAVSVFPQARGRGVASAARRLAAVWGLRELGLRRVFAEAAADNHASIRAIEKAGFRQEGLLRAHCTTNGISHDCVMFSLVSDDLEREQPDDRPERIVRRFYEELWNEWRLDLADVILSPRLRFRGSRGSVLTGREEFKRYVEETRAAFADWHNQIDELMAAGDRVVTRMTWTGTHTGAFAGIEPSGARVEYVGPGFFRLADGLIEEAWIVGDSHAFWAALTR